MTQFCHTPRVVSHRVPCAVLCVSCVPGGIRLLMGVCSNDGGGGERVLWCGVEALREALLRRSVPARFVIYTGDDAPAATILAKTKVPRLTAPPPHAALVIHFLA